MKLVFDTIELANFEGKLEEWYRARFEWIILRVIDNPRFELDHIAIVRNGNQILRELGEQYDKAHPKPDWRTLL